MSLNKVMLIGNVGQDPEVRYLDGNSPNAKVATLRLATTERYRDRNTGENREITEWHTIVLWRGLADIVEKYVKKGTQLYIEGRIRTRSWDDQNGNRRYTTEILADNLQLLGRRADNPASQDGQYGNQQYQPAGQTQQYAAQPQQTQPQAASGQPYSAQVQQPFAGAQYPDPAQQSASGQQPQQYQPATEQQSQYRQPETPQTAEDDDDLPF